MKNETREKLIEIAKNYSKDELDLFIAEIGWEDWMNEYTEAKDDDEITEREGREIDRELEEVFLVAQNAKIKVKRLEYTELSCEEAKEFFSMDADALEVLKQEGARAFLFIGENNNTVQSIIIIDVDGDYNIANPVNDWEEDDWEDCKHLIDIID